MDSLPYLTKVKLSENEDIILAKNGDKDAFERLIIMHEVSLFRVANGILQNEEDAEDAYQETIIKAYRGIGNLKKNEYCKTWLIRIMINQCSVLLKNRRKRVLLKEYIDIKIKTMDGYEKLELWIAVRTLEEELRQVIILYYYEDYQQNEIGELLGIPYGTVKSRLSRAKEKLQLLLDIKL